MANAYASDGMDLKPLFGVCSAGFGARWIANVDLSGFVGDGTRGNSVGLVAPGSGAAPCRSEQYRPNLAIFDIAIGKLYTWPKDNR